MRKVIIIGVGPAGITAAITLKRNKIDVLLLYKDGGILSEYPGLIDNYYGLDQPISGMDLIHRGLNQAKEMHIDLRQESVISVDEIENGFLVKTEHHVYESKVVLLATGKKRKELNITGYQTFKGKGISLCASCDGYFYRNKKIAVIGHKEFMHHELSYLNRIAKDVTVFANGFDLEKKVENKVVQSPILEFIGDKKLSGIKTKDGIYPIDGAFIALDVPSSQTFALQLGLILENHDVLVNEDFQTNIKGLFAAGDIIGGHLQIVKASYDGLKAAESIIKYLDKQ